MNPIHKHCGPFNAVSKKKSRNKVDEACRQHDIGYGRLGYKAYFYHNKYDDRFIDKMEKTKGFLPKVYGSVFKAKKAIAPFLPENNMSRGRSISRNPPTPKKSRSRSMSRPNKRVKTAIRMKSKGTQASRVVIASRTGFGKSSGFLTSRTPVKAERKKLRISKNGVYLTKEVGGNMGSDVTSTNNPYYCAYLGHATCPKSLTIFIVSLGLAKRAFMRMGLPCGDIDTLQSGFATADAIYIEYKATWKSAAVVSSVATASTSYSIKTLANGIASLFGGWNDQHQILAIGLATVLGQYPSWKCDLSRASVTLDVKSTFKIQNRTVSVLTNDQEDDVDNTPLYGKSYTGQGSGSWYVGESSGNAVTSLVANANNGIIGFVDNVETSLREPPFAVAFPNVRTLGKSHFDAGQLKTSSLSFKKTLSLTMFLNTMCTDVVSAKIMKKFGNFRFFALEKMLESLSVNYTEPTSTTSLPIKLVYEHNWRGGAEIHLKTNNFTSQLVENEVMNMPSNN